MATDTAVKLKKRSADLSPVSVASTIAPPSLGDPVEWAERLRDLHEERGELLTVRGLIATARAEADGDTVKAIKNAYAKELEAERAAVSAAADKPAKAKASAKTKPDKKAALKAINAKITKESGKAARNGKAGKGKPATAKERTAAAPGRANVKTIPNKAGIEVMAGQMSNGQNRVRIAGLSARAVLRWMGSKGWTLDQGREALGKLGVMKFFQDTVTDHVRDQMSSGRSVAKGGTSWAGPVPEVPKDVAAKLKALI